MGRISQIIFLLLLCTGFASAALASGTVSGKVTDLYTGGPIPKAKVLIEGTTLITYTGKNGGFTISNAPAGKVRVSCGAMSYTKQSKIVTVPEGGVAIVNFVLEIGAVVTADEVVVKEKKPVVDVTPQTSAHKFTIEEIQDNAGAFEDVAKVMKKLPGVVQSTSFTADMYVRGNQNWENLILIDDLLLMNPYHFGIGLSIINTDLVKDVTFYAGGFPAKYPMATGSVLDVTYKDGNRERPDGMLSVSMLSANGYASGPMTDDVTWIVSGRRSYYDYMIALMDLKDVPVPVFSDYMIRATYEPGEKNRLMAFLLRSEDGIELEIQEENASSVDEGEAGYTSLTQVYGLSWQLFPVKWFLSTTTLTHQIINLEAALTADTPLFANAQINATYLHNELEFQVHPRDVLTIGGDYGLVEVDLDSKIRVSDWVLGSNIESDLDYFDTEFEHKDPIALAGGFVQNELEIVKDRLRSNVGARFDHYKSDGEGWMISPRAALSWSIFKKTILKGSWGIYYYPPFNILATDEEWGNPDLRPQKYTHYVLGLEQGLTEHSMLRVETYFIEFDDLQFQFFETPDMSFETLMSYAGGDNPVANLDWRNSGYGKSYGLEVYLQKKLSGKWDGWLAYTLAEVLYNDGMGMYGWYHPFQDQRHTLNLVGNFRPWPDWTFSATFGLFSGKPYTPVRSWEKTNEGSFFQGWMPVQGSLNSERMPLYHKLDIRIERMWHPHPLFDLTAFLEIYNVYNQENVYSYWYAQEEGIDPPTRTPIYDLPFLPFGGIKVEF